MLRNIILTLYCVVANAMTRKATPVVEEEPCGYCGDSQDPNDICITCWNKLEDRRIDKHQSEWANFNS